MDTVVFYGDVPQLQAYIIKHIYKTAPKYQKTPPSVKEVEISKFLDTEYICTSWRGMLLFCCTNCNGSSVCGAVTNARDMRSLRVNERSAGPECSIAGIATMWPRVYVNCRSDFYPTMVRCRPGEFDRSHARLVRTASDSYVLPPVLPQMLQC